MTKDSEEQISPDSASGAEEGRNEPYPGRVQGNRFFSCLLIAAVFIIIDLAILLYFLWPDMVNMTGEPKVTDKPVVEQQVQVPAPADDSRTRE